MFSTGAPGALRGHLLEYLTPPWAPSSPGGTCRPSTPCTHGYFSELHLSRTNLCPPLMTVHSDTWKGSAVAAWVQPNYSCGLQRVQTSPIPWVGLFCSCTQGLSRLCCVPGKAGSFFTHKIVLVHLHSSTGTGHFLLLLFISVLKLP